MNDGRRAAGHTAAIFKMPRKNAYGEPAPCRCEGYHSLRSHTPLRRLAWIGAEQTSLLQNEMRPNVRDGSKAEMLITSRCYPLSTP